MSVARQTEVQFDLDVLTEAARQCGFLVNVVKPGGVYTASRYARENGVKAVRITSKEHRYGFTDFVETPDGKVEMCYDEDFRQNITNKMLEEVTPEYVKRMAARGSGRFRLQSQTTTKDEIVLRFRA